MTKIVTENAEEIADKLRDCLKLIEPHMAYPIKMRDAVDFVSTDPEAFARAYLEYLSIEALVELLEAAQLICNNEVAK